MATLKTLTEPYASIRVAVYEPLLVRWMSIPGVTGFLVATLKRMVARRSEDIAGGASAPTIAKFDWRAPDVEAVVIERSSRTGGGLVVRPSARGLTLPEAEFARRRDVIRGLVTDDSLDVSALLKKLDDEHLPHFASEPILHLALSPIGVAHLYRQL